MAITPHTVNIYVDVHDKDELFNAAYARAIEDGMSPEAAIDDLKPRNKVHVGNCLRVLLDPCISPPGCSIVDSSCS